MNDSDQDIRILQASPKKRREKKSSNIVQDNYNSSYIQADVSIQSRAQSIPRVRKNEMFLNLHLDEEIKVPVDPQEHIPQHPFTPSSKQNEIKNDLIISQGTQNHSNQALIDYNLQDTTLPNNTTVKKQGDLDDQEQIFQWEDGQSGKRLTDGFQVINFFGHKKNTIVAIGPIQQKKSKNKERKKNRIKQLALAQDEEINPYNENIDNGFNHEQERDSIHEIQDSGLSKKNKCIAIAIISTLVVIIMIVIFCLIPLISQKKGPQTIDTLRNQVLLNITDPFVNDIQYREILFMDPISRRPQVNFPISKQKYLKALKHPEVKFLPLKFEVNEQCNYTANVKFKVESDSLANSSINGKEQEIAYNVSFFTTAIAQDYITIITHYMQDIGGGGNEGQDSILDTANNINQNSENFQYTFDDNQTESTKFQNIDPDTLENEQDQLEFVTSQTKLSICNISRSGGDITACQFNSKMSFSDNSFSIKLLQMYIPNMNMDHYNKKRRILTTKELDSVKSQESTGSLDEKVGVSESQIGLQSQSKDTQDDGGMASSAQSNSEHALDLDTGKIDEVQKNEKVGFKPSSNENIKSNETTVKSINSEAQVNLKFLNRIILSKKNIEEELQKLEAFDFIKVPNPVAFYNNRTISMEDVSRDNEENNLNNETRLLLGRDMGSSNFQAIDFILGKINMLFITLQGGFSFQCPNDDVCITGLFLEPQPFPRFWPIKREVQANMGKTIKNYRYIKLVFQQNIVLFKNLTDQVEGIIDTLIFNNLNAIDTQFQRLTQPIIDIESNFKNYTDKILKKATQLSECLDIASSIAEVIDSYTVLNIQGFIGLMQLQIDQIAGGFEDRLIEFNDQILQSGSNYSNNSIKVLENHKREIISIFDTLLDKFDLEWEGFVMNNLQKFDFINFKIGSVAQGSNIVVIATSQVISSVLDIVLQAYSLLSSSHKETYNDLKTKVRVQTILYHSQSRQSLLQRFDSVLDTMKSEQGQENFSQTQLNSLSLSPYRDLASQISLDLEILDVSQEDSNSLIEEVQTRIARDISRAVDIVQEILTCADERKFFQESFQILEKGISSINSTIFTNISNTISESVDQFSVRFNILKRDIQSLPENIEKAFTNTQAMNQPTGVIDINQEFKEINGMIEQLEDIVEDFSDSLKIQKRINIQISSIKSRAQSVAEAPKRMKMNFESTVEQIKNIGNKLKLSFKLPIYQFKLGETELNSLQTVLITQIQTRALQYGINNVKLIGQTYGSKFIGSLMSKLNSKIGSILPKTQKSVLYNAAYDKSMTLFQANVPIAFGSLYTQVAQSFKASLTIFYEFKDGKLQIVIDPNAKFAFYFRLAWDLVLVRTGMSLSGTIFEGRVLTAAGFNIFSLTPSAFISSYIYFSVLVIEFALVYQYLWPRIVWKCWHIGRRRCRIRICIPIIIFQWSPWKTVSYYRKPLGLAYKKELISKEFKLSLI